MPLKVKKVSALGGQQKVDENVMDHVAVSMIVRVVSPGNKHKPNAVTQECQTSELQP